MKFLRGFLNEKYFTPYKFNGGPFVIIYERLYMDGNL